MTPPLDCMLGKLPAKRDERNLQLKMILRALPPIPAEWSFDKAYPDPPIPLPMFGNDKLSCCVISGRGHQTLRFERREQGLIPPITDQDIEVEYFKETGGADDGLVVLDSLKEWRSQGWTAAGHLYNIDAFAEVNRQDKAEVMAAIYLLNGVTAGVLLPKSAYYQRLAHQTWDIACWRSRAGSWGGHLIDIPAFNATGPLCVTWGSWQQMTWRFFARYCDECYAIIDNKDAWLKDSPLNIPLMESYLAQVSHN